jgi:hypothetical protein
MKNMKIKDGAKIVRLSWLDIYGRTIVMIVTFQGASGIFVVQMYSLFNE